MKSKSVVLLVCVSLIVVYFTGCLSEDEVTDITVYIPIHPSLSQNMNLSHFGIPNEEQVNLTLQLNTILSSNAETVSHMAILHRNESTGLFEMNPEEWKRGRVPGNISLDIENNKGDFTVTAQFIISNATKPYYFFNNSNNVSVDLKIVNGDIEDVQYVLLTNHSLVSFNPQAQANTTHILSIDGLIIHIFINLAPD